MHKDAILNISSLGNKKNQFNHSQRGDIFYIGHGCHFYKRSIFANPFSPRIYGHTLVIENFRRKTRNTPRLWKALDDLEGKTLACHCFPPLRCHDDLLLELLWEKKHDIPCDLLQDRSDITSSFETGSCELPSSNTRKPLTLSDVCSNIHPLKSMGVVRSHYRSSNGGHGLHVNSYVNPNYHLSPRDDLPFGTGEKRLCDGEVDFDLAVSNKRCLLRSPRVNDPFVLVDGDSQLRTFVSGRVSCPDEWEVLSVPGGRFSHVGDAIGQVVCRDFLGQESPNAIVLMCGTIDLVFVDSPSWKDNFRRLLHRCQYLFPQAPTYAIAPLPRRDD